MSLHQLSATHGPILCWPRAKWTTCRTGRAIHVPQFQERQLGIPLWRRLNTRDGTRAHNRLLRREAPYPLGHTGYCLFWNVDCTKALLVCHGVPDPEALRATAALDGPWRTRASCSAWTKSQGMGKQHHTAVLENLKNNQQTKKNKNKVLGTMFSDLCVQIMFLVFFCFSCKKRHRQNQHPEAENPKHACFGVFLRCLRNNGNQNKQKLRPFFLTLFGRPPRKNLFCANTTTI